MQFRPNAVATTVSFLLTVAKWYYWVLAIYAAVTITGYHFGARLIPYDGPDAAIILVIKYYVIGFLLGRLRDRIIVDDTGDKKAEKPSNKK